MEKNGCERLIFSDESSSRKKRRTTRNCSAKAGRYHSIDSDSMNKQASTTSAVSGSNVEISRSQPMATDNALNIDNDNERLQHSSRTIYSEEPFYMLDGDARNRQVDHRNSLYDLSNFEIQRSQRTSAVHETNRVLVMEEVVRPLGLSDVANINQNDRERNANPSKNNDQALISPKEDNLLMHSIHSARPKFGGVPKFSGLLASVQTHNCHSGVFLPCLFYAAPLKGAALVFRKGERMGIVKTVQVEMNKVACDLREIVNGSYPEIKENCDKDNVCKVVKTEPVYTFELSTTDAVNISFLMATNEQSFAGLPTCLASKSFKGWLRMKRKIVAILRDPVSRLWPVIYQEKYGLKVLTGGWEAFVKANSIRPGDECVFKVENEFECIYRVGIVRK
ncbi:hypothetical protein Acr_00g0065200 [Actinidia rufa]|uniref:TF-B3 domain-containing protein n=1 Tax=Actinidia rufa TaxID=165716 RepID=A0A7J0DPR6_9ERIC|nr:hypothetical protein Acr_00g0065200 [Actinidia rufa]